MITNEQVAWLAGFIEGEGCLTVQKNGSCRVTVGLHGRDIEILQDIKSLFGGTVAGPYTRKDNDGTVAYWQVCRRRDVFRIIKLIYPWLYSRRQTQADKVLDHLATYNII